jgi:hypothetical protein
MTSPATTLAGTGIVNEDEDVEVPAVETDRSADAASVVGAEVPEAMAKQTIAAARRLRFSTASAIDSRN